MLVRSNAGRLRLLYLPRWSATNQRKCDKHDRMAVHDDSVWETDVKRQLGSLSVR